MSEISKALALDGELEYRGQTYRLAPCVFEVMAAWEDWLEARAWSTWERSRTHLKPSDHAARGDRLQAAIDSGEYGFMSENSLKAQNTLMGMKRMVYLRLRLNHPEVTEVFVAELLEEKLEAIHLLMEQMDRDPNPPSPVGTKDTPSPT